MAAELATTGRRWRAMHRFARVSPRKARLVIDLIRGQHVNAAQDILRFTPKRSSKMIDKVLRSAIANASEDEADVRSLYVVTARIDEGPRMRRWRPKDRGRAHPILKRISHIVVEVEQR
ncbi:MAG: 50S ribosomal protein L22 [Planctomycetes bacterium]|nr:50S ribosomal protein L22 [Planctomycetota bacterium]